MSARIGDALSTYRDGVLSQANGPAREAGLRVGMPVREAVRLLI